MSTKINDDSMSLEIDGRVIATATALAVVAVVATIISCQHAYELVRSRGESGVTARLLR
jgi:hypothetical protein